MKQNEILAAIHQMKEQLANCQCQIAVLEELLTKERVNVSTERTQEIPVINEDEDITLPDPPKEINIENSEETSTDEESLIGCAIISKLNLSYIGTCRTLVVQKKYWDNCNQINPKTGEYYDKLYIDKNRVNIILEDINCNVLYKATVPWLALSEWHSYLVSRGINTHYISQNPHENWMPREINICID